MKDEFAGYRKWFYGAAAYNAIWGLAVSVAPGHSAALVGLKITGAEPLLQCIAMIVGVYAYGYYLLACDPKRYSGLIWVGLAGKVLGPIGFLVCALQGKLPWSFGWTCVFNDLIWWPAFWTFALLHARKPLD